LPLHSSVVDEQMGSTVHLHNAEPATPLHVSRAPQGVLDASTMQPSDTFLSQVTYAEEPEHTVPTTVQGAVSLHVHDAAPALPVQVWFGSVHAAAGARA
jgi:hypothetical protein